MKERPILFSASMVRAILDGTKTQTRRVVKPSRGRPIEFLGGGGLDGPDWNNPECWGYEWQDSASFVTLKADPMEMHQYTYPCPYGQPGDRLWVREAFCDDWKEERGFVYRADGGFDGEMTDAGCKWRPSIHMPRAASRITLEVTGVRVERLQDISEADAQAEGCADVDYSAGRTYRHAYRDLWESINGEGAWSLNPWVWVVSFHRMEGENGRS
jgi:hypothetical protein